MKKITALLLMISYLIPVIGLSVKQHYCGGELTSISILFSDSHSCSCVKKPMKKDCCKNKTTILKLTDTQNFTKKVAINFSKNFKFLVPFFPVYHSHYADVSFEKHLPFAIYPPPQKSEALYLLNRVFLI